MNKRALVWMVTLAGPVVACGDSGSSETQAESETTGPVTGDGDPAGDGDPTGDGDGDPTGDGDGDPTGDGDGDGDGDPTGDGDGDGDPYLSGDQLRWHPLVLSFPGPSASETDTDPNPFLDYRLEVVFETPSGETLRVPGYFAGDGTDEGGESGDQWRVAFTPDELGKWSYAVEFRAGEAVAIELDPGAGRAAAPDGISGDFWIDETDKQAPDFRATGFIEYTGEHYLRTQDGALWIKGGTDSPENLLGYADFDATYDLPGGAGTSGLADGVHRYTPHEGDWQAGDPQWGAGLGHGLVGAINYLASVHVNSVYFLPCNIGGDGRETWPYAAPDDLLHFDLSKLAQWQQVLAHAQRSGLALHVVLNETESGNEELHDGGQLGVERKLFYRELVARFGHHPGLFWNIGEENDYGPARQLEFAAYLDALDPWDHPTTVHTHVNQPAAQYDPLVGEADFDMTSIQLAPTNADQYTEQWRQQSADAGRPWAVMLDEISPAGTGVTDQNAAQIRRQTLWPAYLSGAGGVEWYFGYHDLPLGGDMRCEDFRTREAMFEATWIARQFIEALPLTQMEPDDALLGSDGQVLAQVGQVYALYLPSGGQTTLDLSDAPGAWTLRWYDVETGEWSDPTMLAGGGVVELGAPAFEGDVAALVELR